MNIYIETYGCTMNKADSLIMESILRSHGFNIVNNLQEADIIIINTCTVRYDTELRMVRRIKELYTYAKKYGKKLIVAGCMAKAQPGLVRYYAPDVSLISPHNIDKIVEVVMSKSRVTLIKGYSRNVNVLPKVKYGRIGIIPVAEGCIGNCSYCIVKIARGPLQSYPPDLIVETAKKLVSQGVLELELTAQDLAAYGLDINTNIFHVIWKILDEVKGNYMIRLGMMSPHLAYKYLEDLVNVLKHPKVYKFVHIPLQSGDDNVLKIMRRPYTVELFKKLVTKLKEQIPELFIATDIMVGHPGENDNAFYNTVNTILSLPINKVHLAQYTIRPHTLSAMMPQIPESIKKKRSKLLSLIIENVNYFRFSKYVGEYVNVFILDKRGDNYYGRTINYIPVVVKSSKPLNYGEWYKVYIDDCTFFDLRGFVV